MEVPGQHFALVSFIAGEDGKACMKVLGAFPDEASANAHCKKLMDSDNRFDVFLTSMYQWVPCAPSREQVQEENFSNQYVEELMKGYEESQAEANKAFEQRKAEMLKKAIEESAQQTDL